MIRWRKNWPSRVLAGGLAAALIFSPAVASATCTWHGVISPNVGTGANELRGVAALASNNVWAVGDYFSGTIQKTLVEHWNGTNWTVVSSPNVGTGNNVLARVVALAANNIWAVGYYTSGTVLRNLILHWTGPAGCVPRCSWAVVASPNVGSFSNDLRGIAANSATNMWAVGVWVDSTAIAQTLTLHWNGLSWAVVPSPNVGTKGNRLRGVTAVPGTAFAWAVGDSKNPSGGPHGTLTLLWSGSSWMVVPSPNIPESSTNADTNDELRAVTALASTNVWAVGFYANSTNNSFTLIEHWSGSSWALVPSKNATIYQNELLGIAAVSAMNMWAVGDYQNALASTFLLTEHWNGLGWAGVAAPNFSSTQNSFVTVAVVPGSTSLAPLVWAVGQRASLHALTEVFHC